jgi:trimethylamine--corrinoid protein Co-methyltransferase
LFVAAQSGANLVHDVGSFLNMGMTGSLELLTISDEIISMISHVLRGFEITDETLAVDVISKVGPGGHYLAQEHTRKFVRHEHWLPTLFDRQRRDTWLENGSKDLLQRAREKTRHILDTHLVPPLPSDIEKELAASLEKEAGQVLQAIR